MKALNAENLPLPAFYSSMLDYNGAEGDKNFILIPFKNGISDMEEFDKTHAFLTERLLEQYRESLGVSKSEFKDLIQPSLHLAITVDEHYGYKFEIFKFATIASVEASIQISFDDDESKRIYPVLKYLDNQKLEEVRNESVQSMREQIPAKVGNKLKLVADDIVGVRYRAAWISYDGRECVALEIANCLNKTCPVEVVEFGF